MFAVAAGCALIAMFLPSAVSNTPYWIDGSHNHPYYPDSGMANISFSSTKGSKFPTNLPSVQDVCKRVLDRSLFPPTQERNGRSLFGVSFGEFIHNDLLATTSDKSKTPLFSGSSAETSAWPWINNNEQSTWLDLSNLYGTTAGTLTSLRNQTNSCKLRLDLAGNLIRENGKFVTGDQRAAQSPLVTGWHLIFTKEHNWQCDVIARTFPQLNSDELFYHAREATILVYQKMIVDEYLPGYIPAGQIRYTIMDRAADYAITEKNVAVSNEFAILSKLNTMVPDSIQVLSNNGTLIGTYSSDQGYYNIALIDQYGLNALLRGAMSTPANQYGRGYPSAMASSMCQIDLLQSRERNLATYADAHVRASLPQVTDWSSLTSVPAIQAALKELYGTVENVELLVGAYLNNESGIASFGTVTLKTILEQMVLTLRADRWSIVNFDMAPRDLEWQNQLVATTYNRNLRDLVKQHTRMPCVPSDVLKVGDGALTCA
ncbi:hypothetical protein HDU99_010245 [Rhizoclosmatium hyalinum]|nr:hypothetical protein HDU99_010245 [Rhizoclosmatium hyalinum]